MDFSSNRYNSVFDVDHWCIYADFTLYRKVETEKNKMKFLTYLFSLFFISCTVPTYDIIIKNGQISDGTGAKLFPGDIYIRDGKIIQIGQIKRAVAEKILDAKGLIISPGFIDMHTHSERRSLDFPTVENYLQQGVTTMVGGNCGGSPFPIGEFIDKTEKMGIGPNLALLVGHNTVRREIMGT